MAGISGRQFPTPESPVTRLALSLPRPLARSPPRSLAPSLLPSLPRYSPRSLARSLHPARPTCTHARTQSRRHHHGDRGGIGSDDALSATPAPSQALLRLLMRARRHAHPPLPSCPGPLVPDSRVHELLSCTSLLASAPAPFRLPPAPSRLTPSPRAVIMPSRPFRRRITPSSPRHALLALSRRRRLAPRAVSPLAPLRPSRPARTAAAPLSRRCRARAPARRCTVASRLRPIIAPVALSRAVASRRRTRRTLAPLTP
ncbi:hypothetical protein DENSPDRAFT_886176 [Dentipellis sp. KUC8613]|nr:hypothetical protein DENSPDRAFT_886176 [Dentipellis sp. KUC8613]